jgi:hypothetical protein
MIVPQIHQHMQISNHLTVNFNQAKYFSLDALIGSSSSSDPSKVCPGGGANILCIISSNTGSN